MLKVYKAWLQQYFALLLWYELNYGIDASNGSTGERLSRTLKEYFYKSSYKGWQRLPQYGSLAQSILNRNTLVDCSKVLPDLHDLLLDDTRRSQLDGEGDLINVIVNALRLPYAFNHLSGGRLDVLRRQLLLPQERAEFNRVMQPREMACSTCGHEFLSGEMATHTENGFVCSNCYTPSQMACRSCEGTASVPERLREGLRKVGDCGCKERSKEAGPSQPEVEIPTRVTPMGDAPVAGSIAEQLRGRVSAIHNARYPTVFDEPPTAPEPAFPTDSGRGIAIRGGSTVTFGDTEPTTPPPTPAAISESRRSFLESNRRTRRRPTNR